MSVATDYNAQFFETIREGCKRSAEVVVPLLLDHYQPETVVDVGCGEGHWGAEFERHGCSVAGLDGEYARPVISHVVQDLARPLQLTARFHPQTARFDLAVCLEVAEHLPPERADSFIVELCRLAPVVLFSAAVPGQGGTGHLNEQWPAYWVERFEANGFRCSGALRWPIWEDDRVENWYRQNLMVAARDPGSIPTLFDTPLAPIWPVVHPVLFEARCA